MVKLHTTHTQKKSLRRQRVAPHVERSAEIQRAEKRLAAAERRYRSVTLAQDRNKWLNVAC